MACSKCGKKKTSKAMKTGAKIVPTTVKKNDVSLNGDKRVIEIDGIIYELHD